LNSAIGYITPKDMLAGHQQEIQAERDRKLDAARKQRKNRWKWRKRSSVKITERTHEEARQDKRSRGSSPVHVTDSGW
jgi:hypothetical protein